MATAIQQDALAWRELDRRYDNGLEVVLEWKRADGVLCDNLLRVVVADEATGAWYVVYPAVGDALDAFQHPFRYRTMCLDLGERR